VVADFLPTFYFSLKVALSFVVFPDKPMTRAHALAGAAALAGVLLSAFAPRRGSGSRSDGKEKSEPEGLSQGSMSMNLGRRPRSQSPKGAAPRALS